MAATKVLSNKHVTFLIGAETEIDDWDEPTLADIEALENLTGAINTENTELNISASPQQDDRVWTDEAGAQSRGETEFGGALQFGMPKPTDTSSILRTASDIVRTPGSVLAAFVRTIKAPTSAIVAGDEVNGYRVQTNIPSHGKNDVSHFYDVEFLPRDDVLVNYIIPSASPTVATLTPSAAVADAEVGDIGYIKASYEGRRVTIGATWTSSDSSIVEVSPHGIWRAVAVGGPVNIQAKMPGGTISVAKVITVVA